MGDIETKSDQRPLVVNEVASRCCGGRAWDRHGNQIGELTTLDLVLGLDLRGAPGKVWFRSGHVEIDRSVRTRDHCGLRGLIVASQNGQVLRDSAHGIPRQCQHVAIGNGEAEVAGRRGRIGECEYLHPVHHSCSSPTSSTYVHSILFSRLEPSSIVIVDVGDSVFNSVEIRRRDGYKIVEATSLVVCGWGPRD